MDYQNYQYEFNRAVTKRKRPSPLSIRFSDTEKLALKEKAGNKPVGRYIRELVLADISDPGRKTRLSQHDHEAISRLTAKLGQSRISSNLNQLAKLANMGSLPVDDEVTADLNAACTHISEMRSSLLRALGQRR